MQYIKDFIDFLTSYGGAPTISFTLLTVGFPFVFPPTDWFDKKIKSGGYINFGQTKVVY